MTHNDEINELKRILASPQFKGELRRKALRFICEKRWEGQGDSVTQYDIAEELHGDVDEVGKVRVLMGQIRDRLDVYYTKQTADSGLRLEIPVGSYNAVFTKTHEGSSGPNKPGSEDSLDSENSVFTPMTDSSETSNGSIAERSIAEKNSSARIKRYWMLLISIPIMIGIGYLTYINLFTPRELSITSNGRFVFVHDLAGNEFWNDQLEAPVVDCDQFESRSSKRFFALFGGMTGSPSKNSIPPKVRIFTKNGDKACEDIDLLHIFNPFNGYYADEYFQHKEHRVADLDVDGHLDLLVIINHLFYPTIIYVIDGESLECKQVFANAGDVDVIKISDEPVGQGNQRVVAVLAVNNLMAGQFAMFYLPAGKNIKRCSPNPEIFNNCIYGQYRPVGARSWNSNSLYINGEGELILNPGESQLYMNKLGVLSTDSCWLNKGDHGTNQNDRFDLLLTQEKAVEAVRKADIAEGVKEFNKALSMSKDSNWESVVRIMAARVLMSANEAEKALNFLPDDLDTQPVPYRFYQLNGDLLTILGNREVAKESYRQANEKDYQYTDSIEGYVHSLILSGSSYKEIYEKIRSENPNATVREVAQAWPLLPCVLRGECDKSTDDILGSLYLPELDLNYSNPIDPCFPEEAEIVRALYDLEAGRQPKFWPDENVILAAPCEYGDVFHQKIALLRALKMKNENGEKVALNALGEVYSALVELSGRDAKAVVPSVIASYHYGFAAVKTGHNAEGVEALQRAFELYPWGRHAIKAKRILVDTDSR